MKKLSFFLMAMLFSVMSFAQDAPIYELVPASGTNQGYATNCDITIDGIKWNLTGNSTMQPWRIGGKNITKVDRALYSKTPLAYNIDKIEVTHGTASSITVNSFKLIISDEANGAGETIDVAFKASATTTIDLPEGDYTNKYFKFLYNVTVSGNNNKYVQFTGAKFYAALAEDAVKAPIIKGAEDFISETEVTIEAEDDVTVYYTLDGTEPTNASTVYAAPFTVKETTTVKAIAYRGETASFVTSATFTQATRVTAAEAAELAMKVASNNALTSVTYVINAYVTEVIDQTLSSGQQRFWVADTKDGGQVLQSYYCNVPQVLKVGDYVQMFGKLTKYNTSPQMKNGDVTIAEEPVIEEPTIECKDALDFGAVAYNAEVAAQTLEVTGYNLTSDITVTLSEGAAFTVDKTTLSAEGGNLVVTPVSPLTVGTHTATLTLASGEATAEVTLTIVAKDVYTITWSVNGETTTTSVVEGDKLVLPAAPEAPEACSEKVFVGWTAAEEVNADGSDIEWVTAATIPTTSATYYAVFAAQEGEGGQEEVSASVTIADYATANSWTNGVQYPSITIDTNITATAAGESNTGKYYTSGNQWRFYQGEGATLTITAAEGITISTVAVIYAIQNTGILTLDGVNIESEAICNINASSVTFGVGNTEEAANGQVRVTKINVTYFAGAAATYTDYSTTCEAEPEYEEISLSVTDLEIEMDEQVILKGTAMMQSPKDITISLVVDASEANEDGTFNLTDESEITFMEAPMTFISGVAMIDLESKMARAIVRVEFEGMYFEFTFDMTALVPAIDVVVDDATITVEKLDDGMGGTYENITVSAKWNESVLVIEGVEKAHEGFIQIKETFEVDGEEDWYIWMCMNGVITTVDNVLTVKGEFKNNWTGDVYNVTISGTLPSGATGLENLDTTVAPAKAIVNGQLVIVKDGVQYNAQGAVVK